MELTDSLRFRSLIMGEGGGSLDFTNQMWGGGKTKMKRGLT